MEKMVILYIVSLCLKEGGKCFQGYSLHPEIARWHKEHYKEGRQQGKKVVCPGRSRSY